MVYYVTVNNLILVIIYIFQCSLDSFSFLMEKNNRITDLCFLEIMHENI